MAERIRWLSDVDDGHWSRLGAAARLSLPVPRGFVATSRTPEENIRTAYDELKVREHTHYVAIRTPAHAVIEIIGNDAVIHVLGRVWSEVSAGEVLVQSMVNASWCGKAVWEGKNLRIRASEGLQCLDPDMYLLNASTGRCTRRTLYQRPRKVFRGVDGTTRTMEVLAERHPMNSADLESVLALAGKAETSITWALDDRRVWLLSVAID